jgi:release factor glutamine methyltransferase
MPAETARAAIADAAGRFGFSDTARLDAELLMAHAMGVSRQALLLGRLDDAVPDGFAALVERRERQEPIAYITGTRAFWTVELSVGPGVLVPRADSETLIEAAVDWFQGTAGPLRVLDLGTGSGALLLAALAEWPAARGLGVDASADALAIAKANAERLNMQDRAIFRLGDWSAGEGRYDLILCNPPYIASAERLPAEVAEWEPASALFAGADGLDDYRAIIPLLPERLASGGVACVEIGAMQADAVRALAHDAGLRCDVRHDLAGHPRCCVLS